MSDEQDEEKGGKQALKLAKTIAPALAGLFGGPAAALAAATGTHILTNLTVDSAIRKGSLDFWADALADERSERREQYQEIQDEFGRHQYVVDWLKEDLLEANEDLRDRVDQLEILVLGLMSQSEEMLRANPDPEMRPYLLAAFRNTVRNRNRFSPTQVRRLMALLKDLGGDHLRLLVTLYKESTPHGPSNRRVPYNPEVYDRKDPAQHMTLTEMDRHDLLQDTGSDVLMLRYIGCELAEFVTDPKTE